MIFILIFISFVHSGTPIWQGVDILVATPGRMLAHLNDTVGVAQQCSGVKVLILDEADRLLDMGFKR